MKRSVGNFLVFAAFCAGCHRGDGVGGDATVVDVAVVTPGEGSLLSDAELERSKSLAASGDPAMAFRVAQHYFHSESDSAKFEQWSLIAAENGNPIAMENVASALWASGDRFGCTRAIYWLERIKNNALSNEPVDKSGLDAEIAAIENDMSSPGGKCDIGADGGYYLRK